MDRNSRDINDLRRELELKKVRLARLQTDILATTEWNPTQIYAFNSKKKFVMVSGMNQGGKSTWLCANLAVQATGRYPKWWRGIRYKGPGVYAIGGETATSTRDLICNRLFGTSRARGTGFIPAEDFDPKKDLVPASSGVRDQIDHAFVRHYDENGEYDGDSQILVFSYSLGWKRVQGYTIREIDIDEEPPFDVFDEFTARLIFTGGNMRIALTPLSGRTPLIARFEDDKQEAHHKIVYYDIRKATHLSEERRAEITKELEHSPNAEARLYGKPVTAKGIIFTASDEQIAIDEAPTDPSLLHICGIDFPHTVGTMAFVKCMWDEERKIFYVVDAYKDSGQTWATYWARARAMGGATIPVSWPHDGGRAAGDSTVAEQCRDIGGLNMLPEYAHMIDISGNKTNATSPAIEQIAAMMWDGRFKVVKRLVEWFDEKATFRHDQGKIVKGQEDHLIDATIKAFMSRRFAEPGGVFNPTRGLPPDLHSLTTGFTLLGGRDRWPTRR